MKWYKTAATVMSIRQNIDHKTSTTFLHIKCHQANEATLSCLKI